MNIKPRQTGFTLVELMVAVGVVGVLAAIAIPTYTSYVTSSTIGTAQANAEMLAAFEDTYYYENDTYLAGTYDPPGTDTLTAALDWKPQGDNDLYAYVVTAGPTGDIATSYSITVTYKADTTLSATVIKEPNI